MQTSLAHFIRDTPDGIEAERILRTCVHCGFCNATCPTYQLLGNELDGPRGRIYLIKQLLEGETSGASALTHLDRCLTCRSCESTCPSGVEYGRLADIGRRVAEANIGRSAAQRLLRYALRKVFTNTTLTRAAFAMGRAVRPVLPRRLREQVPPAAPSTSPNRRSGSDESFANTASRRVLLLAGCVQQVATPQTNSAVERVLQHFGIETKVVAQAGCCGAISHHLNAHDEALNQMRRNIDAWSPELTAGAQAIVFSASGCGAVIKDYGYLLREDPHYAERAARVSALARDVSELLSEENMRSLAGASARPGPDLGNGTIAPDRNGPIAFHPPCSLQHGLKLNGTVEALLRAAGIELTTFADPHLCCGSAGTYSILQSKLSEQLLESKLHAIEQGQPAQIVTANIGCQLHLQRRAQVPVRHWLELIDDRIAW
jgi:glycolate oxidase iron-sulfur subunit